MKIREYIEDKDFPIMKDWITDERTHAMWCANRTAFPLQKESFRQLLDDIAERCGDRAFVATDEDGKLEGFFCYSINKDTGEGMLKFVMVDPARRGKGLGREMIRNAVQYAFDETGASVVQLMVFSVNERAGKCYKSVGFTERQRQEKAFSHNGEEWDRINMVMKKTEDKSGHALWLRKACPDDAERLVQIYAYYVLNTAVSFEYDAPTVDEFRERIIKTTAKYPYLVCMLDDKIIGYAYAGAYSARQAYDWTATTSIYVDKEYRRMGAGALLYGELEKRLKAQGVVNLLAGAAFCEEEDEYLSHDSCKFHTRMGYTQVAHMKAVGKKFDRWYDLLWYQKRI